VVAGRYGWLVQYGLLDVDFFYYVFGIGQYVALLVLDAIECVIFGVFEYYFVYSFRLEVEGVSIF
jgi:hypothetical protein